MMSPIPLRVLGVVTEDIEAYCHETLQAYRLHGEWFAPSPNVLAFIRDLRPLTPRLN